MSGGLRMRAKMQWARLTDSDLDSVGGEATRLLDRLEERYGYTRPRAEHELLRFLDLLSPPPLGGMRGLTGSGDVLRDALPGPEYSSPRR